MPPKQSASSFTPPSILPIRVFPCHPWWKPLRKAIAVKNMLNNNEQLTKIIIGAAMNVLNKTEAWS
jgi:hypothetical protein